MIISADLAEFFGILTGDGYIAYYEKKHDYIIEIAGDSRHDCAYLKEYVSLLAQKVTNVRPTIIFRKNQNSMYLRIRSKKVYLDLVTNGFKTGRKEGIGIPLWIKEENEYMKRFVRGFADTDGCLSLKREGKYPVIKLATKSKLLANAINEWLKSNLFSTCTVLEKQKDNRTNKTYTRHCIYLNGAKNLENWMNNIGFSNKKHLNKYEEGWGGRDLNPRHSALKTKVVR